MQPQMISQCAWDEFFRFFNGNILLFTEFRNRFTQTLLWGAINEQEVGFYKTSNRGYFLTSQNLNLPVSNIPEAQLVEIGIRGSVLAYHSLALFLRDNLRLKQQFLFQQSQLMQVLTHH